MKQARSAKIEPTPLKHGGKEEAEEKLFPWARLFRSSGAASIVAQEIA
jgi:hypothetical protein